MTLRAQSAFIDGLEGKDNRPLELPPATFAAFLGDVLTGDVNSPSRNYIPATAAQSLVMGTGASVIEGVLTTNGTDQGFIRSDWITGSDVNQDFEVPFVLIDAGYGSNDSSLALFSIAGEDDLNYYAKVTTSTDPVETRALILQVFDKSTAAGLSVRLENGLGLRGVHLFRLKVTPSLKRVSLTHMETGKFATANLPTFSWSGRLCIAQGHAYRGLQGVAPNRTYKGAEKFRVSQSLGFIGVAQHVSDQETKDAGTIITGSYIHPKVSLSPTSATLKAGDPAITFKATVTDSTKGVVWSLEPANLGTLAQNGLACVYTPPATLATATSVRITATLTDGRAFDSTGIALQTPVVVGPAPKVSLAPTSLTVKVGDPATTFTATVQNSTAGVTWKLEPSNLGTLTPNGLTASYKPPSAPGSATVATITATLVGDATVYDPTRVNIQEDSSVPSEPPPVVGGPVILKRDNNFKSADLPDDRRGFYVYGFESVRNLLKSNDKGTESAPFQHNDATGNAFARVNTTQYNTIGAAYLLRRDPLIIDWLADRFEIIINGMKGNVGTNIPFHPGGKSSHRKAIEKEAYYDKDVTVTSDDGSTFKINWVEIAKLIYIRRGQRMYYVEDGVTKEDGDNMSSGTDVHMHDGAPRLASIIFIALLLDQNRDRARPAGKESIASMTDWFYTWLYQYLAFYRYRSANSTQNKHFKGLGGEKPYGKDGKEGTILNWRKVIAHDFVQQCQMDANCYLWATLREGPNSPRAKYWDKIFRSRTALILKSMGFVGSPNGKESVIFGHSFSEPLVKINGMSEAAAYTTGAWLPRYCDDMYPAVQAMTMLGLPGWGDGRVASALANSFGEIAWISDTKVSSRTTGPNNKFTDGTSIPYPSDWPKDGSGRPYKLESPSNKFYEYGTSIGPEDRDDSVASVNNRFKEVQGYEIIQFDPTSGHDNIKRCLELCEKYANFTPAKGKASATSTNNVFAKMQLTSYMAADRFGIDVTKL